MTTPPDEVAEALEWHQDGTLLYTLKHAGWRKGVEQFENATTIKVHGDNAEAITKTIRAALTAPGMKWQTIDSAPKDGTEIEVRIGRMIFPAKWEHGFLDDNEKDCGGWVATEENHHPACWTSGVCWQTNEDGQLSEQPEYWRLPAPPAAK